MDLRTAEDVAEKTLNKLMHSDSEKADPILAQLARKSIGNRWDVLDRIGSGGFGMIYKAIDKYTKDYVALKVEKRPDKSDLQKEVMYYRIVEKHAKACGVNNVTPLCMYLGKEAQLSCAVFDLMGPSLSDLFYSCGKRFGLKTVLMLADQMIDRLQFVHQCGIIHGDVKPGNFVIGKGDTSNNVYIIDFGLSNFWCDQNGTHIPYNSDCPFKGTYRYASIHSHAKAEPSRRDDLESLGYVLIYFLKGKLPWQNMKVSKNKRRRMIGKQKESLLLEKLTENLPIEFYQYMYYVRNLGFVEKPNYCWLRSLFQNCLYRLYYQYDYVYDWTDTKYIYNKNPIQYEFKNVNPFPQMSTHNNNINLNGKLETKEVISISSTENLPLFNSMPVSVFYDNFYPMPSSSSSSMTMLSPCTTVSYAYAEDDYLNPYRQTSMVWPPRCDSPVYYSSSPSSTIRTSPLPYIYEPVISNEPLQQQTHILEPQDAQSCNNKKRKRKNCKDEEFLTSPKRGGNIMEQIY